VLQTVESQKGNVDIVLQTVESQKGNVNIVLQTLESQQGKCRHSVTNRRKSTREM